MHVVALQVCNSCLQKVLCMQEFRRLSANLGAARDRAELFAGSSETSIPIGGQVGSIALLMFVLRVGRSVLLFSGVLLLLKLDLTTQRPCMQLARSLLF